MSILIKGMKMPKDGCHHMICLYSNGTASTGGRVYTAIPVPPHGRLIDADDAFIDADERGFDFWSCDADIDSAQEFLKAQPTVIEAEEGYSDERTN